jgi:small subunit ribosomal protein S8
MSMTDPIADFLARIKNGIRARKLTIECPRSTLKLRMAEILRDEGFALRYDGRAGQGSAITGMRRVSRPGQRSYVPAKSVPRVRNGLGIAILSTSQGVMTDREARTKGVGGEILCEVW